jgi:hypothetical protein
MGFIIFDSLVDAQKYTKEIERAQGIPRQGTDTWGEPIKSANENLWAVVDSTGYNVPIPDSAVDILPMLPVSWWGNV